MFYMLPQVIPLILARIFALLSMAVAFCLSPSIANAQAQPWIITLDSNKGITYFDAKGGQLFRSQLTSPAAATDYLDIEMGNFIEGNNWLELLVLRKDFWFDAFPLPRPGEQQVRRHDYFRFETVSGENPIAFSLANYSAHREHPFMFVLSRNKEAGSVRQALLYNTLNTGQRSQLLLGPLPLTHSEISSGVILADVGLNSPKNNFVILTQANELWLGSLEVTGNISWNIREHPLPRGLKPQKLRLVGDTLYLLDAEKKIHRWKVEDQKLTSSGKPVTLKLSVDIISFTPLAR